MDGYQRDIDNEHIRISMFVCLYFDTLLIIFVSLAQSSNTGG